MREWILRSSWVLSFLVVLLGLFLLGAALLVFGVVLLYFVCLFAC